LGSCREESGTKRKQRSRKRDKKNDKEKRDREKRKPKRKRGRRPVDLLMCVFLVVAGLLLLI
jgi:hypothetical protein